MGAHRRGPRRGQGALPRERRRGDRARQGRPGGRLSAPLVVSLLLADEAQERFDRLRAAHFPSDRLVVGAHVTLFHALPGEQEPAVAADLRAAADRPAFEVSVTGVRSLGRGVAYTLDAPELTALRRGLADVWEPWLTPQDRQRHSPHVTVQNKVEPAAARALLAELSAGFTPERVPATGLGLWRYVGGPWEPVARFPFG